MAKKILLLLLAITMMFSLTACSLIDKIKNKDDKEKSTTTETTESANEEESETQESPTIEPIATTLAAPGKVGDWIETMRYSSVDGAYHKAYYRITDIVRYNKDVEAALNTYNSDEHTTYFEEIDNEDIEYCMIKYEVYFPAEFPVDECGISSVAIDFSITTPSGDDIKVGDKTYTDLKSVYDITETPEVNALTAGQTFKDGVAIFSMVKDYNDFIIKSFYINNNQLVYSYVKGE